VHDDAVGPLGLDRDLVPRPQARRLEALAGREDDLLNPSGIEK
jgi:hypothetical protein